MHPYIWLFQLYYLNRVNKPISLKILSFIGQTVFVEILYVFIVLKIRFIKFNKMF